MPGPIDRLQSFLRELKRRSVYRAAATYAIVAFVTLQAAQLIFPATTLAGVYDVLVVIAFVGFPLAVVLAWAVELSPEGVRLASRTESGADSRDGVASDESARPSRRTWNMVSAMLLGLGTVFVTAAAGWFFLWGGVPDAPGSGDRSIAVLPFDNLSGTGEGEPYVRGLHDDLLTRLSGVADLTVISRRAVERYRGSDLTTADIADELNVRWVVAGGVTMLEDQIQVNAQLIDPRTEAHAWVESYTRDLTAHDLFAIQSEITQEIARSLDARLTAAERERVGREPTDDLAAYRLYVEGRTHLDQRTESGLRQGTESFREAIALDSSYALAWAGLSDGLSLLAIYGFASADTILPKAENAVERALQIDPDLAEAHASRGLIHQSLVYDGPTSLRALRRAVELKPSYARAYHWLSNLLMALGRLEEAGVALRRAVELDPHSPPLRVTFARWYEYSDSLDAALEQARRAEELSPTYPSAPLLAAEALAGLGRTEEAEAALHRARQIPGVNPTGYPGVWVELAVLHHGRGDSTRVRELIEELEARGPTFAVAAALAGVGERDTALALISGGPMIPDLVHVLRYHRVFGSMRGDVRFEELLQQINLAWGLESDGSLPGEERAEAG